MTPLAASRVGVTLLAALAAGALPALAVPRTFTVDTTVDSVDAVPGDGICADANGHCSLRAAVMEANRGSDPAGDRVDVPAGLYTVDQGPIEVTASMRITGAGSAATLIEGDHVVGLFDLGSVLYAKKLFEGKIGSTPVPRAVPTTLDSFLNCLAAEGCLAKPGFVDMGGSNPIGPITFSFAVSAAERAAVAGADGLGVLNVVASRDLGHKLGAPGGDAVAARLDGQAMGDLFAETIDTCPRLHNDNPIDFACGPNFHNDTQAQSSLTLPGAAFQTASGDGTIDVVLAPISGAISDVGRIKFFSAELLYLKQVSLALRGITVRGGGNTAIFNKGAAVEGDDVVVRDNNAVVGAALWNEYGRVILRDSTIAGNVAYAGGGIFNAPLGSVYLERSTVSGNKADLTSGGGILSSGIVSLVNSTVSGNLARLGGGGIQSRGYLSLNFSTVTDNSANFDLSKNFDPEAVGGGIANVVGGRVDMANSILAGNRDGRDSGLPAPPELVSPDCFDVGIASGANIRNFLSVRDNVVGVLNANCLAADLDPSVSGLPHDHVGTAAAPLDAGLDPLADNGGFTRTHALMPGSPAIDADVDASTPSFNCPATDQRSFRRPGDNPGDTRCDVGAYEAGGMTAIPVDPASGASPVTVTFSSITTPGITRISIASSGPALPAGFQIGNPPVYFELSTTVGFTPPVTVCFDYTGLTFTDPAMIRLMHYEDTTGDGVPDAWVALPTTVDTVKKSACAIVTSFSLFAPAEAVNRPPVARAGPDQSVECSSPQGARITLDGTASSDPDGDTLTFEWTDANGGVVGNSALLTVDVGFGASTFTLTVDDGRGLTATDEVVVSVSDTAGPAIGALTATPNVLWPPNQRMVSVVVSVSVADVCDPNPTYRIVSVSNDETGLGDAEITGPLSLSLRAERSSHGAGRTYRATVESTDSSGNTSLGTVVVIVPHDQR
jgi:CSLREA domain-containing protein